MEGEDADVETEVDALLRCFDEVRSVWSTEIRYMDKAPPYSYAASLSPHMLQVVGVPPVPPVNGFTAVPLVAPVNAVNGDDGSGGSGGDGDNANGNGNGSGGSGGDGDNGGSGSGYDYDPECLLSYGYLSSEGGASFDSFKVHLIN